MDSKNYHNHLVEYTKRTWSYQTQCQKKRQLSRFNTTDRNYQLRNSFHRVNIQTWQSVVHVFIQYDFHRRPVRTHLQILQMTMLPSMKMQDYHGYKQRRYMIPEKNWISKENQKYFVAWILLWIWCEMIELMKTDSRLMNCCSGQLSEI